MKAIFVLKDCMRSTCTKASTRTIAGSVVASGAMAAALVAAAGSGTFSLFQNDGWLAVINHSVGICRLLVSTYSRAILHTTKYTWELYHTTKGAGDSGPTLVQYARAIVVSMQRNEPCCCNNNPIAGTHSLTWSSASLTRRGCRRHSRPPLSFETRPLRRRRWLRSFQNLKRIRRFSVSIILGSGIDL